MQMPRGILCCLIIVSACIGEASAGSSGPIRLVVPFPAGGPTDIVARPYALMLGDALKTNVIVDNRAGAAGSIGAELVAKSAPDGNTLLMATVGTHAINASLYKKLAYDPVRDFTPIALLAAAPVTIVVHPSQPVRDVAALIALAKTSPGSLSFGTAGSGTPGHLTGEMFKTAAGVNILHVPYKGSAPAVIDLIGGHLQLMFDPLQSVIAQVQAGKLRAIAVSSRVRASALPNVPTIAESGFPGFETTAWWGVFAPAHLVPTLAVSLAGESERIVRSSAFQDRLTVLGVVPTVLTLRAFGDFQRAELAKWGKAVKDSGATAD